MADEHLLMGEIVAAHGIKGLVKVRSFTEVPEDIVAYGALHDQLGRTVVLSLSGPTKGGLLVALPGITNRNDAEALKGTQLFVDRGELPKLCDENEEYYHVDLIGLSTKLRDGKSFGHVRAIYNFGAGDLLEIQPNGSNETIILRFDREKVLEVDLDNSHLVIANPADENDNE